MPNRGAKAQKHGYQWITHKHIAQDLIAGIGHLEAIDTWWTIIMALNEEQTNYKGA